MENQVVDAVTLGQSVMAHDMSLWGLFMQAGLVVKTVMIGLLLASVWVWAIVIEKVLRLRKLRAQAHTFEEAFWSGGSLEDLYDRIADKPRDRVRKIVQLLGPARLLTRQTIDQGVRGIHPLFGRVSVVLQRLLVARISVCHPAPPSHHPIHGVKFNAPRRVDLYSA